MNKIEYDKGTCARIEISEDANNADQKVKRFSIFIFPSFYSGSQSDFLNE